MILQKVLDVLQTAANAGFAQTEVLLSVDNTQHKDLLFDCFLLFFYEKMFLLFAKRKS